MKHIAEIALPICIALATGIVAFMIGRRWRREYSRALALRQRLEAQSAASATAQAASYGNVVELHVGHDDTLGATQRELYIPGALRPGLDRGPHRGQEALTSGDHPSVPLPVELYRPTRLSRLILGTGGTRDRNHVGSESGDPSRAE